MEYMTVKEAAELWGYSEETIRKWCRNGIISITLHAEKVSNRWQIPKNALCPKQVRTRK
jgi:excisionase family DNA binding protein